MTTTETQRTLLDPSVRTSVDSLSAPYEVLACDPSVADTAVFCETFGIPPEQACNTIIVAIKTTPRTYAACLVLGNMKIDVNHKLAPILGTKRISFAAPEETAELTGMMIGGVTVFALPASLPIYIDASVMQQPKVVLGGGNRSSKVLIDPKHLTVIPNVQVADIAIPRV